MDTSDLNDVYKMAEYLVNHKRAGHTLDDPRVRTDVVNMRDDCVALVGESDHAEVARDTLDLLRRVAALFNLRPVGPTGRWVFTFKGRTISGSPPMPVSIIDDDEGWGVRLTDLVDAAGEPAAEGTTVAYAVDDAELVTLTDNGDGSATFSSALAAAGPSGKTLPASTVITAQLTNPDGTEGAKLQDVITVVAGTAVTGNFEFTPPA